LDQLAPLEIQALAKIMDELDYYQILHLNRDASAVELKKAYFSTSRAFHPDANRHLEPVLLDQCQRVSKRVTEAYCVLKDPRKRKVYDERLDSGEGQQRMQLSEAKAAHAKQETDARQGKTPQGRQYLLKATEDAGREDWAGAIRNLQMALTFEPDNSLFKDRLEEAKQSRGKAEKSSGHTIT